MVEGGVGQGRHGSGRTVGRAERDRACGARRLTGVRGARVGSGLWRARGARQGGGEAGDLVGEAAELGGGAGAGAGQAEQRDAEDAQRRAILRLDGAEQAFDQQQDLLEDGRDHEREKTTRPFPPQAKLTQKDKSVRLQIIPRSLRLRRKEAIGFQGLRPWRVQGRALAFLTAECRKATAGPPAWATSSARAGTCRPTRAGRPSSPRLAVVARRWR